MHMTQQTPSGALRADDALARRIEGRVGESRRRSNPVIAAYSYHGDAVDRVVDRFRVCVSEWSPARQHFDVGLNGGLVVKASDSPAIVVETSLETAPLWLREEVFFSALQTNFDLLEGPHALGVVVRHPESTLLGVCADHAVADGPGADAVFAELDAMLGNSRTSSGRRVGRTRSRKGEAVAGLRADEADMLVRRIEQSVSFCDPGAHASSLSRRVPFNGEELRTISSRTGASEVAVLLGAYAEALLLASAAPEVHIVTPVSTRLLAGSPDGLSRLVALPIRARQGHLTPWLRDIQNQLGNALVGGASVADVVAAAPSASGRRVPWAFFGWERTIMTFGDFRHWQPNERQLVTVRPGVTLSAVASEDGTLATIRLQENPGNQLAADRLARSLAASVQHFHRQVGARSSV